jgi:hypothetical protein
MEELSILVFLLVLLRAAYMQNVDVGTIFAIFVYVWLLMDMIAADHAARGHPSPYRGRGGGLGRGGRCAGPARRQRQERAVLMASGSAEAMAD